MVDGKEDILGGVWCNSRWCWWRCEVTEASMRTGVLLIDRRAVRKAEARKADTDMKKEMVGNSYE
jgi:hypothetical protein